MTTCIWKAASFFLILLLLLQDNAQGVPDGTAELESAWDDFQAAVEALETTFKNSSAYQTDSFGAISLIQSFVRIAMDTMAESGDGFYPHFGNLLDPDTKIGIDNPDTFYRRAFLQNENGNEKYVISGTRGTTADFLIQIFAANEPQGAVAILEDEDMQFGPGGTFQLILSAVEPQFPRKALPYQKHWLELPAAAPGLIVIVRNSFCNWRSETSGSVNIRRIGTEGVPAPVQTPSLLEARIRATSTLANQGPFWSQFGLGILQRFGGIPNLITPWVPTGSVGIPTQFNALSYFQLQDTQALIITAPPTDAAYHGFHITNVWGASPDWPNRQTSLSWGNEGCQAYKSTDRLFRFVLSAQDPGVENWIDISGLSQGLIAMRLQSKPTLPTAEDAPEAQVVNLVDLATTLPADTPRFGPKNRKWQLLERQNHARRRYINW